MDDKIGERIKCLRTLRKMTREEFSEKAGISPTFLYQIETGRKGFSAYTLCNIAKAFGLDADYILYGEAEKFEADYVMSQEDSQRLKLEHVCKLLENARQEILDMVSE